MTATADSRRLTIANRVDKMHEEIAGQIPEEILAAFGAEQAGLAARGIPDGVAVPGDKVPDARLLSASGDPTTLADTLGGRPAVVVLYRGAWCPYCNLALRSYQEDLVPPLDQRGIALVAVSPQKPDGSLTVQQKNELAFAVLSDPGNQIASALGVLTAPTEGTREAQRAMGIDLLDVNADGGYGIPMPTVVVVDETGTIRWIDVHPNYTTRTEVADILAAVNDLG
ncbi:AhpC/TSA family protein [Mycolicibacterium moriokaense]|nr:AhpC/TSA family protein [Mycolicibacterium moriokaense]